MAKKGKKAEAPETKEVQAPQKVKVKNISNQNWMAFNITLAPGETYKPGMAQLKETRAMAKIARAVDLGKLEWV